MKLTNDNLLSSFLLSILKSLPSASMINLFKYKAPLFLFLDIPSSDKKSDDLILDTKIILYLERDAATFNLLSPLLAAKGPVIVGLPFIFNLNDIQSMIISLSSPCTFSNDLINNGSLVLSSASKSFSLIF